MYTICDLIEILILIEKDAKKMYSRIADKSKNYIMLNAMAKTLANEEAKHVKLYENLKNDLKDEENIEIDVFLYDKVAKLLYEFRSNVIEKEFQDTQKLIKYALEFEKKNVALLLDIQGKLVLNLKDVYKVSYEVISKLIKEEKEHEKELQVYLYK